MKAITLSPQRPASSPAEVSPPDGQKNSRVDSTNEGIVTREQYGVNEKEPQDIGVVLQSCGKAKRAS